MEGFVNLLNALIPGKYLSRFCVANMLLVWQGLKFLVAYSSLVAETSSLVTKRRILSRLRVVKFRWLQPALWPTHIYWLMRTVVFACTWAPSHLGLRPIYLITQYPGENVYLVSPQKSTRKSESIFWLQPRKLIQHCGHVQSALKRLRL